jgi:hypothetical protein
MGVEQLCFGRRTCAPIKVSASLAVPATIAESASARTRTRRQRCHTSDQPKHCEGYHDITPPENVTKTASDNETNCYSGSLNDCEEGETGLVCALWASCKRLHDAEGSCDPSTNGNVSGSYRDQLGSKASRRPAGRRQKLKRTWRSPWPRRTRPA